MSAIPIEERCKASVLGDWHSYRCERRAVRDGYCKQHHPDAKKARAEKSHQRAQEEWEKTPAHQLTIARARIAELERECDDWRDMYSIHVRPKCGSDMAYNAQVAFDLGCVHTDREIAAEGGTP